MKKDTDIVDIKTQSEKDIRRQLKDIIDKHTGRGTITVINAAYNSGLHKYIEAHTEFLNEFDWVNFSTRCYVFANNITDVKQLPHCATCGKLIRKNVISVHVGFKYATCSRKCSANETSRNEKRKATMLELYDDENYNNREKYRNTCLERFGVECNLQSEDNMAKAKATKLERYGDENYVNSEQAKQTCLEKYGMGNDGAAISEGKKRKFSEDPDYYKKIDKKGKDTRLELYGDENYNNRQLSEKTKTEKYGNSTYNNREKASATCSERYGVDNPAKLDSSKDASKNTCLERYGVDNPAKLDSSKEKSEKTNLEKFGVSHYQKTEYARLNTSIRKSSDYFNAMIKSEVNTAVPMFEFDDFRMRSGDTELKWKCKECGCEFQAPANLIYARQTGTYARCPHCHPAPATGYSEQQMVEDFLKSIYEGEIKTNDRHVIYPLEIDMYMPKIKAGIEFDGLYWHSAIWRSDLKHMAEKSRICENKGIHLLQIMEDEWKNFRKQTEWQILQFLGLNERNLPENYIVQDIAGKDFDLFMLENSNNKYIKYGNSKIGIFDKNVMIFAASFTVYKNKIIIYTAQNVIGRNIPDCISALVKELTTRYGNTEIFARLDNRYQYDKPLINAGFKLDRITAPAKWILDAKKWRRVPRQKYARIQQIIKDKNDICEIDYLHESGMTVIYDCGQRIYKLIR